MDFLDKIRTRAAQRARGEYRGFEHVRPGVCFLQHDMTLDNQAGAAYRADNNNALGALVTLSSGATAPATTFAYMLWADTTTNTLKRRNAANSGWLVVRSLSETFTVARSSNTILAASDVGKTIVATGTFTQTFTAAATLGDGWWCELRNDGTGVITLNPAGSELIDGQITMKLNPREGCTIVTDGSAWYTLGLGITRGGYGAIDGLTLDASVAASALTISLKNRNGDDPTPANPVRIPFRNATAATGDFAELFATAATSLVISSGSTMGAANGIAFRLWIVAFNDAGTLRIGAVKCVDASTLSILRLSDQVLTSSTAEGGAGAADSAQVIYTGTAVTTKAMRILGYLEWSAGLATAGTWGIVPTKIQIFGPGIAKPGDVVTEAIDTDSTQQTTTADTDTATGLSVAITIKDAANVMEIDVCANVGNNSSDNVAAAIADYKIKRGATTLLTNRLTIGGNAASTAWAQSQNLAMNVRELAATPGAGSATYVLNMADVASGTVYVQYNNNLGRIRAQELMG